MDEILPCPFCGGEAEPVNYSPFDGWHCRCKRCDLEGNEWLDAATAVRAWNRRVPPVAVQEERDAWQPIETVPASADDVLVLTRRNKIKVETGHYARNCWLSDDEDCLFTHWMPAPPPPAAMKGDQP